MANKTKISKTVQDTIPFVSVLKDGIFQTGNTTYSKMYAFEDSNFVVESEDKKDDILLDYVKLINRFQENVSVEMVIVNKRTKEEELFHQFHLKDRDDDFNEYRHNYNAIIDSKIKEGRNDIQKERYAIVTVNTKKKENAISTFHTIDTNLNEAFASINGSGCKPVTNLERLKLMRYLYRGVEDIDTDELFHRYASDEDPNEIDNKKLSRYGTTAKNLVAPDVIIKTKGGNPKHSLQLGENRFAKSYMFNELPLTLNTEFLSEISNIPCEMVTSVLFTPSSRKNSMRGIKVQNNAIKGQVYDRTLSGAKKGVYDKDLLIDEDLQQAQKESKEIRNDIMIDGKKIFYVTICSTLFSEDEEGMKENIDNFMAKCSDYIAVPNPLIGQQIDGLSVNMLCGNKLLRLDRMLSSDSCCALFPFNIQELMDKNGRFYGINAHSKNMIMYNRRTSDLPNGIVLGRSGSGKSFIIKGEIIPNVLAGNDDIVILDPDGEYVAIANALGGTVIDLDSKADIFLNPLDMSMEWDDPKADPLSEKKDFMVGFVEAILGNGRECNPLEVNVIHRCVDKMYEPYIAHMTALHESGSKKALDTEASPTLVDFYTELINDNSAEGTKLSMIVEQYCVGTYDLFAHKTNVTGNPRFLVYNLKHLPEKMLEVAMKVCLSNIWNKTVENVSDGKATWIYLDEFYIMMQTETSASTIQMFFKRIRKYFGIVTGITQDIEDLMKTSQGRGMIENSGFMLIMNQSPTGRDYVQKRYRISDSLIDNIKDKPVGHGLLYTGKNIIPLDYKIPNDTTLYKLMTTKPSED